MGSELWQFAAMALFFAVALLLWLGIVYLPGRTLERWEDRGVKPVKGASQAPPDEPNA